MDRETLIEAAREAAIKNVVNGIDSGCSAFTCLMDIKTAAEQGFDAALSLLQWKDVADGLPKVEGKYLVQMKQFNGATVADYAERHRDSWLEYVVAYVPMKITEYEKQETTKL